MSCVKLGPLVYCLDSPENPHHKPSYFGSFNARAESSMHITSCNYNWNRSLVIRRWPLKSLGISGVCFQHVNFHRIRLNNLSFQVAEAADAVVARDSEASFWLCGSSILDSLHLGTQRWHVSQNVRVYLCLALNWGHWSTAWTHLRTRIINRTGSLGASGCSCNIGLTLCPAMIH